MILYRTFGTAEVVFLGHLSGGICPGGICQAGICPDTEITYFGISNAKS